MIQVYRCYGFIVVNSVSGTLRRHVAISNSSDAELQQPPVVPIINMRRALLARDADDGEAPHIHKQDVLEHVEHENKKGGVLVG